MIHFNISNVYTVYTIAFCRGKRIDVFLHHRDDLFLLIIDE